MTILVTGAAGFIGSQVARRLAEQGHDVLGLDNFNDYYDPRIKHGRVAALRNAGLGARLDIVTADFADAPALAAAVDGREIDAIVHLGAQPGVRYSITHPEAYIRSNLVGHANMLELARRLEVGHFVYASSSSVYGNSSAVPFSVDGRVDAPASLYAATKKADELLTESYCNLYRMPATGLRFFTVYGRWGRPDMAVWDFTRRILDGETIPIFNHGEMQRDFTHVSDIVDGVVAALEHVPADDGKAKPGGATTPHALYNLGNHRPEQLMDLVRMLEQACGRPAKLDLLPMQPGEVIATFADISESTRDLGFLPKVPLADGAGDFVDWFRAWRRDRAAA